MSKKFYSIFIVYSLYEKGQDCFVILYKRNWARSDLFHGRFRIRSNLHPWIRNSDHILHRWYHEPDFLGNYCHGPGFLITPRKPGSVCGYNVIQYRRNCVKQNKYRRRNLNMVLSSMQLFSFAVKDFWWNQNKSKCVSILWFQKFVFSFMAQDY